GWGASERACRSTDPAAKSRYDGCGRGSTYRPDPSKIARLRAVPTATEKAPYDSRSRASAMPSSAAEASVRKAIAPASCASPAVDERGPITGEETRNSNTIATVIQDRKKRRAVRRCLLPDPQAPPLAAREGRM